MINSEEHPIARRSDVRVGADIAAGLLVILLTFVGVGAWATLAPLSGAVIARGVVKVDTNRKTVQHFEGGIVKEIKVRDGERVQAGQTLLVVEDARVSAVLDVLEARLDAELVRAARLQAERDGHEQVVLSQEIGQRSHEPKLAELIRGETTFFRTKRDALQNQIQLLKRQVDEIREEITGLKKQVTAEEAAIHYLQQEIAANEELAAKQFVQKFHLLSLRRGIEEYRARLGEHNADIARAKQKATNLELRIDELRAGYVREAADQLTESQARIFDLEEQLRPSRDAIQRQRISAPVSGEVVNLKVFTVGGVIRSGDALLEIVPDGNPLIIEAKVDVKSIDDVRLGMLADIRLTAYSFRSTPLITGNVSYVSGDSLIDEKTGAPYYLAHINVERNSLDIARGPQLYPGMAAEVFIKTGERTALDYLLEPVTASLRRAFREP